MLPKPQDAAGWSHQPRSSSCSTPSLLAEAKDHANRSSVAGVVDDLPAGNVRDSFPTAADEVELQGKRAPALDPSDAPPHDLPRAHQRADVVVATAERSPIQEQLCGEPFAYIPCECHVTLATLKLVV